MKTKINQTTLFTIILLFVFPASHLQAQEDTHFRSGIFGNPPAQYEFRNSNIRGYLTSFPLEEIKNVLGDENLNSLNIDYWIYTSSTDVEMAMVEKMELLSLSLKNTLHFPLEDGLIGDHCWQSVDETGTILFARNNAIVFITPEDEKAFNSKIIEQSARKIDSVLIENIDLRSSSSKIPAPEITNFEIVHYPKNWDDFVRLKIEANDTTHQNLYIRKYGTGFEQYSETGELTTSLNKNTDSIDNYNRTRIKVWVWNENHLVTSVEKGIRFMIYPGKYMLTENDLPGYEYIDSDYTSWQTGEQEGVNGIRQRWKITRNDDDLVVYIYYFEFENEQNAILGTSYDAHSYSGVHYFGSHIKELTGNISYVTSSVLSIQKWNIGFKILMPPPNLLEDIQVNLVSLSNEIITKINDSIPDAYIARDVELKKNQIAESDYNELTADANTLLFENNYSEIKTDDTKWVYSVDSLIMGLRKQWANEKSLFTIDAVKLSDELDAELVGKKRDTISYILSPFCWLNSKDSIDQAFEKFPWFFNNKLKFITTTGVIDNYAIFFHYQHKDSIDFEFFKSVLKSFADNGTSVGNIKLDNLKIYPNPTNETFTIETQNPEITFGKLYNSTGVFIKTLSIENGVNTYNISELESGIYFIQVLQKEGVVVKKFVKN